jgi:Kdo2-lipid IVA lauroyltransferase/acyltransferase
MSRMQEMHNPATGARPESGLDELAPAAHSSAPRRSAERTASLKNRTSSWREKLEFAGFRLVAAAGAALPLETASAWSGWCWRLVAPRLKRHRRALDNLALAYPEMSADERQRVAVAMWDNLGRTFAEFFHLPEILAEERLALEPFERFEAIAKGGPFVVCVLHMGNWELCSQAGLRFGVPLAGFYRGLSNPLIDAWILQKRAPMYPGGLFEKTPGTIRALLRLAKEGGYPAFVADQREGRGVETTFFGHPAMSTPFPALIARTVGMPLYAARVLRKPGVRFTMRIEPVEAPRTADRDADVRAATQGVQSRFEEFVREAPEQWMWAHRRWD